MPTSAHAARTDFTKILGEFVTAQRADVGIGPYNILWLCIRIRIGLLLIAVASCNLSGAARQLP